MYERLFTLFAFFLYLGYAHAQDEKYQQLMEQDWANLKKYRKANEKIIAKGDFPGVIFMGNSITEGWSSLRSEFFSKHDFLGRGIGGQTTPQMLLRFIADVIDLKPQAVVILAGTNDIAGNTGYSSEKMITDNITAMAQLAEQNRIRVILASVLPVHEYPWNPGIDPVKKIAALNKWIKDHTEANEYIYQDFYSVMADSRKGLPKKYAEDGVHPTTLGYQVMEPLALKAISKVLDK
ncbi:SGNH/GDSL hydrolase family protein [Pontixanthobacter gangjinensis]|uniref:Acylhydrolase n=1 Tax=Christiangramia aestuarii TaxID=1028746 RepID=A0A7K1LRQ9_9FLAO|nr:SGNH/GDSL hydrolase family protein [Christiangramia aestuarii]MUP43495.1 acylhydrolase [Christiangramia aestuarii]